MKKVIIIALAFAFNVGITVVARAATPSISAMGDYDGTSPAQNNYYWSIYGSNLSNRTGGPGVSSSFVYAEYLVGDGDDGIWVDLQESGTFDTPTYWYESPSQINFYFTAENNYWYDQTLMQEEYYTQTGDSAVYVENSDNQASYFSYLAYQP
jgi:hypothetical protein